MRVIMIGNNNLTTDMRRLLLGFFRADKTDNETELILWKEGGRDYNMMGGGKMSFKHHEEQHVSVATWNQLIGDSN